MAGLAARGFWSAVVLTAVCLVSACAGNPAPDPSPALDPRDERIRTELAAHLDSLAAKDVFSGAVLVARGDKPIFLQAYGLASREEGVPNTVDTRFNVGSMTKMFTAVAVARLAEEERLSFDDPVGRHLPDFPNDEVARKVTIHHLLTHTSGMGDYLKEEFYDRLDEMRTVADLLPLFVDDSLSFEPGEGWDYSNAGFALLGLIIERVTGRSYFDYVAEHVFERAGMTRTDFSERDARVPDRAVGYMRVNASGEPDPSAPRRENTSARPARGSPAGGAYSTVGDMLMFARALDDGRLLSPELAEIVTTGKVRVPPGWPMTEYAYGFAISDVDGGRVVGHGGTGPGVGGRFETYPDPDYTAVVLSNYDLSAIMPVLPRIRELVFEP